MDRTPMLFVRLAPWADDDDRDLPRRGYGYRPGMNEQEIRDSVRAWWVLSEARASKMRYVAAVVEGRIVGVWEITPGSWRSIDGRRLGRSPRRWAFEVREAPADMRVRIVGEPTPDRPDGSPLFGSGSVIAYWPEPPR
jgi:hypothetical protein